MRPLLLILFLFFTAFSNTNCKRKVRTLEDGDSSEFKSPGPVPNPPGTKLKVDEDYILALTAEQRNKQN